MEEKKDKIGIVLSGSNTRELNFQLLKEAEKGEVQEGKLIIIKTSIGQTILGRISSIIPFNAFYYEGDAWSEARRHNKTIPEEISRQYEICHTELLMQIPRTDINYPPRPGDGVYSLDLTKQTKEIFDVEKDAPGYIWLGTLAGYSNSPIPLNIEKMPMHFAVFGVTGSGKSFNTGVLIERLMKISGSDNKIFSYPMIIVDAHGDYLDYSNLDDTILSENKYCPQRICRYIFPKAFRRIGKKLNMYRLGMNLDQIPFQNLAEIIVTYYKGSIQDSDLQISGIVRLFDEAIEQALISKGSKPGYGSSINKIFTDIKKFEKLKSMVLDKYQVEGISSGTRPAIVRQLEEFRQLEIRYELLSAESELQNSNFIDEFTSAKNLAILDFSADGAPGIDLKTKQMIITYIATILFNKFTDFKMKGQERYLAFILEEAQNFCPSSSYPIGYSLSHSILSAIATQGRKFGLSLGIITQRPSFVDKIILSMCNTFFIQRISPEDFSFVQNVTGGLPASLSRRLTNLETGRMVVSGQMLTTPFPLLIRIPKESREIIPTIGKTSVTKTLGD